MTTQDWRKPLETVPADKHRAIPTKDSDVIHDGPYADRCEQCAATAGQLARKLAPKVNGTPVGFGSVVRIKRERLPERYPEWVTITEVRLNTYTGEVWLHAFALGSNLILKAEHFAEVRDG